MSFRDAMMSMRYSRMMWRPPFVTETLATTNLISRTHIKVDQIDVESCISQMPVAKTSVCHN